MVVLCVGDGKVFFEINDFGVVDVGVVEEGVEEEEGEDGEDVGVYFEEDVFGEVGFVFWGEGGGDVFVFGGFGVVGGEVVVVVFFECGGVCDWVWCCYFYWVVFVECIVVYRWYDGLWDVFGWIWFE